MAPRAPIFQCLLSSKYCGINDSEQKNKINKQKRPILSANNKVTKKIVQLTTLSMKMKITGARLSRRGSVLNESEEIICNVDL